MNETHRHLCPVHRTEHDCAKPHCARLRELLCEPCAEEKLKRLLPDLAASAPKKEAA
jgi:hypothetical protein